MFIFDIITNNYMIKYVISDATGGFLHLLRGFYVIQKILEGISVQIYLHTDASIINMLP